jgi:hypothetical protein
VTDGNGAAVRPVRLEHLSVSHLVATRRHLDDLLQEFRLIGSGMETGILDVEVPRRLVALAEALNQRYESERLINRQMVDAAIERGDETVTLELLVPVDAAGLIEEYRDLLEQADEYCRRGALLTLELPREMAEFRRQVFDDLLRQLRPDPS